MRVNFLTSVDFYNPIVNFIEKQSKLRLLVGAVALGIFAGVALYRIFNHFWANRDVQPKEQEVDLTVKKATEVLIDNKLPKPDPEVQEKKEPVENVNPQTDIKLAGAQNQPIQETIVKLDNKRIHVYVERKIIMIVEGGPNSTYLPSQQVLKEALQQFPGNVYLELDNGRNLHLLFYRDAALQSIEFLEVNDSEPSHPDVFKLVDIWDDPNYVKINMVRLIDWATIQFDEARG